MKVSQLQTENVTSKRTVNLSFINLSIWGWLLETVAEDLLDPDNQLCLYVAKILLFLILLTINCKSNFVGISLSRENVVFKYMLKLYYRCDNISSSENCFIALYAFGLVLKKVTVLPSIFSVLCADWDTISTQNTISGQHHLSVHVYSREVENLLALVCGKSESSTTSYVTLSLSIWTANVTLDQSKYI